MTIDEFLDRLQLKMHRGVLIWEPIRKDLEALLRTETERCAAIAVKIRLDVCPMDIKVGDYVAEKILCLAPDAKLPEPSVHDELMAACKTCESAIRTLCNRVQPIMTDNKLPESWINVMAARHLARRAIERAETEKGES